MAKINVSIQWRKKNDDLGCENVKLERSSRQLEVGPGSQEGRG